MMLYKPIEQPTGRTTEELADELVRNAKQTDLIHESCIDRLRTGDDPLEVPLTNHLGLNLSLGHIVRRCLVHGMQESSEPVLFASLNPPSKDEYCKFISHASVMDAGLRIIPPTVLARLFRYGFWPVGIRLSENAMRLEYGDVIADEPWEFRVCSFVLGKPRTERFDWDDTWFQDKEAVRKFAEVMTEDHVEWEKFSDWYKSYTVRSHKLAGRQSDPTFEELPQLPRGFQPRIVDSKNLPDPDVGDFIRRAIIETLKDSVDGIIDITCGPEPWSTDRISVVYDPAESNERIPDTADLCHPTILGKLCNLGYRPVEIYWTSPMISHEGDIEYPPRRIEFARGEALAEWFAEMQFLQTLSDMDLVENYKEVKDFDWATYLPALRTMIGTPRQFWRRGIAFDVDEHA